MAESTPRQRAASVRIVNVVRKKLGLPRVRTKEKPRLVVITPAIRAAVQMQVIAEVFPELLKDKDVYLPEAKQAELTKAFRERLEQVRKGKVPIPELGP